MACPKCGCKVHYQYCDGDFGPEDERWERCAACGKIFDIEDAADDGDDFDDEPRESAGAVPKDELTPDVLRVERINPVPGKD